MVDKSSKRIQKESAATPRTKARGRPPGRPSGGGASLLNRQVILNVALQLTKTTALPELSMIKVAKELGVAPNLIHYYLGARGELTSGVINEFYKEVVESWPSENGDWQHNLEVVCEAIYRAYIRYAGVAAHMATHNRYRMVQDVKEGEVDYGVLIFEKFSSTVLAIGFEPAKTATYAHLLMEFITANAHATVRHRWPGEHSDFLTNALERLSPESYPTTHLLLPHLSGLNAAAAFSAGLRIFIKALALERGA